MPCSCTEEGSCSHPATCEFFTGLPKSFVFPLEQQEKQIPVKQQQQQQKIQPPLRPDFGDSGFDADEWQSNE